MKKYFKNTEGQLLKYTNFPTEIIEIIIDYINTDKKWCKGCGKSSEKVKNCTNCKKCFCEGKNIFRYGSTYFYCLECIEDTDDEYISSDDEYKELVISINM